MVKTPARQFSQEEHRILALWAAECAERVLPLFEQVFPQDNRPRKAIETCRTWAHTGEFRMAEIRAASLAAHAAARSATGDDAACFAARAAGQAVATAHVAQHAYGGAYYALKAVAAMNPAQAEAEASQEREQQAARLPAGLREEIMPRIKIERKGRGIYIRIQKGEGF